jgi:hypothetical protein
VEKIEHSTGPGGAPTAWYWLRRIERV